MTGYKIELRISVPDDVNDAEVEEWAKFETGANCSMSEDNPLCGIDIEPKYFYIRKL